MSRFQLDPMGRYSKRAILVDTESEFFAEIDTDDVPRAQVLAVAEAIVRVLNDNAADIPS